MSNTSNWLCLYIYIRPPFKNLLVNCLLPIKEELEDRKLLNNFFFIIYYENGSHIRYRLSFFELEKLHEYKGLVSERILKFIEENGYENSSITDNFIHLGEYEPEYNRYGGLDGIKIAENIFNLSSITILKVMKKSITWNYNASIINAVKLNYIMLLNLTTSNQETLNFFVYNYYRWVIFNDRKLAVRPLIKNLHAYYINYFMKKFNTIKHYLVPELTQLYVHNKNKQIVDENLNVWALNISEEALNIKSLISNNGFVFPEKRSDSFQQIWSIYDSYVHMNNNRLGIRNQDEAFVAFLIVESIKNMKKSGNTAG